MRALEGMRRLFLPVMVTKIASHWAATAIPPAVYVCLALGTRIVLRGVPIVGTSGTFASNVCLTRIVIQDVHIAFFMAYSCALSALKMRIARMVTAMNVKGIVTLRILRVEVELAVRMVQGVASRPQSRW